MKGHIVLRTFVYVGGSSDPQELAVPPSGLSLAALQQGRKVRLWWDVTTLDEAGLKLLQSLAPSLDRLWIGRLPDDPGQSLQPVFDGPVVEVTYDPSMVSLTAFAPVPQPREPYPPTGAIPVAQMAPPPRPASTQPVAPPRPVDSFFVQARQGQQSMPTDAEVN